MKFLVTIIWALGLFSLPLIIIVGEWMPFAIVVIGLLIGMLIPSVRQDAKLISMIRRKQEEVNKE